MVLTTLGKVTTPLFKTKEIGPRWDKNNNTTRAESLCRNRNSDLARFQRITLFHHHARQKASLRIQGTRVLEDAKLEIMPLVRRPGPARRVAEDSAVVHAQEVGNAVAVLVLRLPQRHDAVHDARERPARQEAQAVAHVDDGVAGPRLDELPALGRQREVLEPPLRREQEGEGSDVRVLVVTDVAGRGGAGGALVVFGVAQEAERREGRARVRVVSLEARGAREAQLRRETREDHQGDGVGLLEEREEAVFLGAARCGEVR